MERSCAFLLTLLALGGCSGPDPSATEPPIYLVRHEPNNALPMGLAEGVVELKGKCLYLTGNLGSDLLVWPHDAVWGMRGDQVAVVGQGWAVAIGDSVAIAGGGYGSDNLLTPFVGVAPPCPGPYLWVSEVEKVLPGG